MYNGTTHTWWDVSRFRSFPMALPKEIGEAWLRLGKRVMSGTHKEAKETLTMPLSDREKRNLKETVERYLGQDVAQLRMVQDPFSWSSYGVRVFVGDPDIGQTYYDFYARNITPMIASPPHAVDRLEQVSWAQWPPSRKEFPGGQI